MKDNVISRQNGNFLMDTCCLEVVGSALLLDYDGGGGLHTSFASSSLLVWNLYCSCSSFFFKRGWKRLYRAPSDGATVNLLGGPGQLKLTL